MRTPGRNYILRRRFEAAQAYSIERNARELKWMRETEKPMLLAMAEMLKKRQGQ